jgi:hypothetical protein
MHFKTFQKEVNQLSDRFNNNGSIPNPKAFQYDKEMQLLNNMESVHSRKKAAFNELLRYTFNNLPDQNDSDSDNQTP